MKEPRPYFFSYCRKDAAFVLSLAAELRRAGANLWLDQLDIRGGQKWDEAVEGALRRCCGILVVLSPEAVASSNVMDEVSYALEEGKLIVPLIHKPCEIPFRLRRLQYVDFTADHDKAVVELLRAIDVTGDSPRGRVAATGRGPVQDTSGTADAVAPGPLASNNGTPPPFGATHPGPVTWAGSRALDALAGFVSFGALALFATLLTALLPTETRALEDLFRREPVVFLLTFLMAGTPGAVCGAVCGRDWRLIRTVTLATLAAWAIGLWLDPRYEGTQVGFVLGPVIGSILAAVQKRRSRRSTAS